MAERSGGDTKSKGVSGWSLVQLGGVKVLLKLTSELLVVAWRGPLALLDHLVDGAADLGACGNHVVHAELVERSCLLDVLERRLEVLELCLDLGGGSLRLLDLYTQRVEEREGQYVASARCTGPVGANQSTQVDRRICQAGSQVKSHVASYAELQVESQPQDSSISM